VRAIGDFSREDTARRLGDYLYANGITNDVEKEDGAWTLWVHDDDLLPQAEKVLREYQANPEDPRYRKTEGQTARIRKEEAERDALAAKRQVDVRTQVFGQSPMGTPYFTFFLIALCVLVQILAVAEKDLDHLHISGIDLTAQTKSKMSGSQQMQYRAKEIFLPEITGQKVWLKDGEKVVGQGQIWRLVTPILLHFGWMHFLFNLYWLYFLGGGMEGRLGTGKFLIFILLAAVFSNLGQYLISGPNFGGMSGVNYGLFGYLWIRGNRDPSFGLQLDQGTIMMLLIWFAICFTGLVGPIANTAHTLGLVTGVSAGWLAAQRAMR